ncbi:MAG: terminase large subunit domain-containing protein [Thermoplasmataceae archaeon]
MIRLPSGAEAPVSALRAEAVRRHFQRDPCALATSVGLPPDPWQAQFLRSTSKRLLVLAGRQVGKSQAAALLALHTALFTPKSLTIMIAPSQRQSRELFGRTRSAWDTLLDWSKSQGVRVAPDPAEDNVLSATFANGSRIVALPASASTVRGFSSVALYVEDESAFVRDELYKSVVPMLLRSGGRQVLLTTPFGKRGHFYEAWQNGGTTWQRISTRTTDCPHIGREELDELRRQLGPWFAQEAECEFLDVEGAVFTREQLDAAADGEIPPLFDVPKVDAGDVPPLF